MSNAIPIQLSSEQIVLLEQQYNSRRPMLIHVAIAVKEELQELLIDRGYHVLVKQRVLSGTQFVQLAKKQNFPQPLVQLTSQINLTIIASEKNEIESIHDTIETHYQSVEVGWKDGSSQLTLKFLVPPQARPPGYRDRDDVPKLMQVSIASSNSEPKMTAEGNPIPPLALIMKGGGIKGLAYVGAMELLRDYYDFNWFVGTSAGSITAILLAAGYSVEEMKQILEEKNFEDFLDAPAYLLPINLIFKKGLHPAKTFTDWMDHLLAEKLGKRSRVTLGDIQAKTGNRITVYASQQRKKSLTFDSSEQPQISAAYAARCSMSIPFIFIPESEQGIYSFDGGLQNNFPIRQLLDDHGEVPFVSLYLGSENFKPIKEQGILLRVLDIWLSQGEDEVVEKYLRQIVIIDPSPIGFLDFDIDRSEKEYLLTCGKIGALKFLNSEEVHCFLPTLTDVTSRKAKLQKEVVKRSRHRWWKSTIGWCFALLAISIFLYTSAHWWFTGQILLWPLSIVLLAGLLKKIGYLLRSFVIYLMHLKTK